ncbi:MAG: alpha/beta fold hydrolase [Sphingosinicella sp.]|uniref:alpha/beta fold hydrolase n=1 Tax=Sphingosinicella sp. TaxID=1917971 RepID=UPI00403781E3
MDTGTRNWRSHPAEALFSTWAAPDGWALRRMDWRQGEGRAARGSLLFVGGRGDFIEKYLEAYGDWHEAGWNVTSFDWRGQGLSQGGKAGRAIGFEELAADLAGLIEAWRADGPGPHVAVAHSMGAHLLLRALVDKRPALDAAVLVAPMLEVNSYPMPAWLAPQIADFMCQLGWEKERVWKPPVGGSPWGSARQRNLTDCRERYEDELHWWTAQPGFDIGSPSWGWLREAFRSSAASFTAEKLANVTLPMLIVATERDRLVSSEAIRRVARQLPDAWVEWINDAAHEILRESDPIRRDALDRIDAFLAGLEH